MKRIVAPLVWAAFIIVLLAVTNAGPAFADKRFTPSCNTNADGHWADVGEPVFSNHNASNDTFHADVPWTQNCGYTGTVEVELQVSYDGGLHWDDTIDQFANRHDTTWTTSQADANTRVTKSASWTVWCAGGGAEYRAHVWIHGSDNVSLTQSVGWSDC